MSKTVKKVVKATGASKVLDILSPPEMPDIPAPTVMPVADEQALAAARKRQAGRRGSGRASTVLTGSKALGAGTGGGRKTMGG